MPSNEHDAIDYTKLKELARRIRINTLKMTSRAGSGHPGPSFSIADILAVLYFYEMRVDPSDPTWLDRDRLVVSKGHSAPGLYATLYEKGFIDETAMLSLRQIDSPLQGHVDVKVRGVDATTGSLGTGFSQAVGMALAAKMRKAPTRVYAILGDGECEEGQIWEAALSAPSFKLDNLVAFIDRNNDQVEGPVDLIMPSINPLPEKWRAFGWRVEEINGHCLEEIVGFLQRSKLASGQPSIAIAYTKKGYGVSFMEGNHYYHAHTLNEDEFERALAELE